MTPVLRDELVGQAREIVAHRGLQALLDHQHHQGPCCCMGPQGGATLCPCAQSAALAANLADIVPEIDAEAGHMMILRQIASIL